jgi:hypothetical protein
MKMFQGRTILCASVFKLRLIHVAQRSDLDCNVRLACLTPLWPRESMIHDHWQISSESFRITNIDEHLHCSSQHSRVR